MISAIVVNYNGAEILSDCLRSLCDQTYQDLEVIVVDNASSDGSGRIALEFTDRVQVIQSPENLGYGGGINAGIAAASGDMIFALNNDIVLDRSCAEHLVRAMNADPWIGMCAPKMLLQDGRLNSTGLCISRSGAAWNRDFGYPNTTADNQDKEILGPCGGAALYRKAMLDQIGPFDELLFMYMEDVDLAFRGRLAGWKCQYIREAVVVHAHGASAGRGSDLAVYYGNRNVIWYVFKDFPLLLLVSSLPWIIGRNIGVVAYYALHHRGRLILRAKIDAIAGLGAVIRKRRTVRRSPNCDEFSRFVCTWAEGEARFLTFKNLIPSKRIQKDE
jgi:GT2 family glycosyltransferase